MIRSFIHPSRRERWIELLSSIKRRATFLDRLNHCRDIDERHATPLPSNADVGAVLRSRGAPETCHVISAIPEIDGREMPLDEALEHAERAQWGTLISCIPGQLAYYYDESGDRRWLLQRPSSDRAKDVIRASDGLPRHGESRK